MSSVRGFLVAVTMKEEFVSNLWNPLCSKSKNDDSLMDQYNKMTLTTLVTSYT